MKTEELIKLRAAKCMFTINGVTYRGTIVEVYRDKITIVSGKKIQITMKNVKYGTDELPKEGKCSVPMRDKQGYTSTVSNSILGNLPRLLQANWELSYNR